MTLVLPILVAAALVGWVFLSLVGNERSRRSYEEDIAADEAAKDPANRIEPAKTVQPTAVKPVNAAPPKAAAAKAPNPATPPAGKAKPDAKGKPAVSKK